MIGLVARIGLQLLGKGSQTGAKVSQAGAKAAQTGAQGGQASAKVVRAPGSATPASDQGSFGLQMANQNTAEWLRVQSVLSPQNFGQLQARAYLLEQHSAKGMTGWGQSLML